MGDTLALPTAVKVNVLEERREKLFARLLAVLVEVTAVMENVLEEKREKLNLNHLQRLNIHDTLCLPDYGCKTVCQKICF